MVSTSRCNVFVLVATIFSGTAPTGDLLAQDKTPPKALQKAQPKHAKLESDLKRAIQLDRLRLEMIKGRITANHPEWKRLTAKLRAANKTLLAVKKARNPIMKGAYLRALDELQKKRAQLDGIQDPEAARKIIDEMQRILLDARKALWELEQAKKKKAKAAERK